MTHPPVRQAAVLVGGLGTRLGALTAAMPKPLLPCGDRPFLAWILRELVRFGIEEVVLLTGYRGELVEAAVPAMLAQVPKPLRVTCVREDRPAGTGGALHHARDHLAERFLLCNGDSWLDFNLGRLLADAAGDDAATVGRMVLRRVEDASRYGVVATDGDRVAAFRERPETAAPGIINAGVYLFDRRILADVQPECSLERDVMPKLAARGQLRGTVADGYFIDIGIPADLERAQTELPQRLHRQSLFLGDAEPGAAMPAVVRAARNAGWHVFRVVSRPDTEMDGTVDDVTTLAGMPALIERWQLDAEHCLFIGGRAEIQAAAALGLAVSTGDAPDALGGLMSAMNGK